MEGDQKITHLHAHCCDEFASCSSSFVLSWPETVDFSKPLSAFDRS